MGYVFDAIKRAGEPRETAEADVRTLSESILHAAQTKAAAALSSSWTAPEVTEPVPHSEAATETAPEVEADERATMVEAAPTAAPDGDETATRASEPSEAPARTAGPAARWTPVAAAPAEAPETDRADDEPVEVAADVPDPVVAFIGNTARRLDDRLVIATDPGAPAAEEYRAIRTSLLARNEHGRHLVHTLTSAVAGEGKTITSLNLGLAFAELDARSVVVVEGDLRQPTFTRLLGLPAWPGLTEILRGQATLEEALRTAPGTGLRVLSAGTDCGPDATQLLSSSRASDLLARLRTRFDHVIVDTPPVMSVSDAGVIGALSDEVLMVVRLGRTPAPLAEQAVRALRSYGVSVSGVVATAEGRGGVSCSGYTRQSYSDRRVERRAA